MPWAWDDRICEVCQYNRCRALSLLFRDYCISSGRGRFKPPNVEAGLRNRTSGDCMQILTANERRTLSWRHQIGRAIARRGVCCTPEIVHLCLQRQVIRIAGAKRPNSLTAQPISILNQQLCNAIDFIGALSESSVVALRLSHPQISKTFCSKPHQTPPTRLRSGKSGELCP